MPLCRVRYRFRVDQANLKAADVGIIDALAEEEREVDEWGEPGAVIRRRWVSALTWEGRDVARRLTDRSYRPRGALEPIGPVVWLQKQSPREAG